MTTKLLSISILLTLSASAYTQTAEKTLSKSFNTEGKSKITLDLPGAVDLKVWEEPTVRIEIHVQLPNGSVSMLNELANVGRYNMISTPSDNNLQIEVPNLAKQVKVKGEVLREDMSFVVYVPKDLDVEIAKPGAAVAVAK